MWMYENHTLNCGLQNKDVNDCDSSGINLKENLK